MFTLPQFQATIATIAAAVQAQIPPRLHPPGALLPNTCPLAVCRVVASPGANIAGMSSADARISSGVNRGLFNASHDGRSKFSSMLLVTEIGTSKIV
jgi:hypothetical protein